MVGWRPQHPAFQLACLELSSARWCNHDDIIIIDCLIWIHIQCSILHVKDIIVCECVFVGVCTCVLRLSKLKTAKMCNCVILDVTVKKILITAFLKKKLQFLAKGLAVSTCAAVWLVVCVRYSCSNLMDSMTEIDHFRDNNLSCFQVLTPKNKT